MVSTRYCLLIFSCVLLLFGCEQQNEEPQIDYATLPEADKRLPENALASFDLHESIQAELFASEPQLINPTNLDIDERGRIWLCEAQNYRRFNHNHPARDAGDRILILEDTDGDGKADQEKTFYQGTDINAALGIAKLGKRVYVAVSPMVLMFTDEDGDDLPDRKDTLFTGLEGVDHDHGVHAVVFGPDGKLYFNFGNEGKQLLDKDGKPVIDVHGNPIQEGGSFRQGMVFRCNLDGGEVEILGHNFRNNFELAVDAYGGMWQSDNDDDGNRGTRINYVMDYGNYGYQDEITGAGWRTPRVGMHDSIPLRHWHLNDPGVIPNLLQTGAGSPTGIIVYEGDALPEAFQGEMIHCEPGNNVVRAYPVEADGAGYTAEILPLMTSIDNWFRPSDVCAAPDGSIFVADWYDAGVGGHLMADIERGRVYRLSAKGTSGYHPSPPDLGDLRQAARALAHVNQATRFLAYRAVTNAGEAGKSAISDLLEDAAITDRLRARLLWAQASWETEVSKVVQTALGSESELIKSMGIRLARQRLDDQALLGVLDPISKNAPPVIAREVAISLRFLSGAEADQIWVRIASQYKGGDRWMLEALGIGSDLHADERFTAYVASVEQLQSPASKDILWRLRSGRTAPYLYDYILASEDPTEMARYFRAFHFLPAEATQPFLAKALYEEEHPKRREIVRLAMTSVSPEILKSNAAIRSRLDEIIPDIRGTESWTMVARNAGLRSEAPILLDSALTSTDDNFVSEAAELAVQLAGHDLIKNAYAKADDDLKIDILQVARFTRTEDNRKWLWSLFSDRGIATDLRYAAAKSLTNDWNGMAELATKLESGEMAAGDDVTVARYLTQSWRSDIQQRAIAWIGENSEQSELDLEALATADGSALKGKYVFETHCISCHQVNGEGVRFGPDLSGIGDKLGTDALLAAIVYPSQGIGFGYEGISFTTEDGTLYQGYVESQTEDEITLRMMGGVSQSFPKEKIKERKSLEESLMTANLHLLMSEEEIADLLAYLSEQKEALSR